MTVISFLFSFFMAGFRSPGTSFSNVPSLLKEQHRRNSNWANSVELSTAQKGHNLCSHSVVSQHFMQPGVSLDTYPEDGCNRLHRTSLRNYTLFISILLKVTHNRQHVISSFGFNANEQVISR
jgi:hypothetical protein